MVRFGPIVIFHISFEIVWSFWNISDIELVVFKSRNIHRVATLLPTERHVGREKYIQLKKLYYYLSIWFVNEVMYHRILPSSPFPDENDPGFNFQTQWDLTCENIDQD